MFLLLFGYFFFYFLLFSCSVLVLQRKRCFSFSLSVINLHFYLPYVPTMHNNTVYNILSLNIRGIRDQLKRGSIFAYLKDHSPKFIFLQETYSEPSDKMIRNSEWEYKVFFMENEWTAFKLQVFYGPKWQLNKNPRGGVSLKWTELYNSSVLVSFFLALRSDLAYGGWFENIIKTTFFFWERPDTPRSYSLVFVNWQLTLNLRQ